MTLRLALTGGLGSGKSLLAGWLRASGHPVVDADQLGRRVVEEEPKLRTALSREFGLDLWSGTRLDRAALGRRAFASVEATARLNALVFPYLWRAVRQELNVSRGPLVVLDAALVFEWGVQGQFAEIWVVHAPDALRLERASRRLGLPMEELVPRLARQLPQQDKLRRATCALDNSGVPARLWEQAQARLDQLGLPGLDPRTLPVEPHDPDERKP
jgi:dephospho-CoA kinase